MTRDELAARDEGLLDEARRLAEAVIDGNATLPRNPAWGRAYDPVRVIANTDRPGAFRIALLNIRIAMRPHEHWARCAHCERLYLYSGYDVTCSPECFAAYSNFLDNQQ